MRAGVLMNANNMQKLLNLLLSSSGEGLSKRAQGLVGIVVAVGLWFGVGLSSEGLGELATQLGPLLENLKAVASGLLGVWGFVRWLDGWVRAKRFQEMGLGKYAKLGKRRA